MSAIRELQQIYTKCGLNFTDAVRAWREASYTTSDIKNQVQYDAHIKISETVAAQIHKYATTYEENTISTRDSDIDAMVMHKLSKLTPNIKKTMNKVGNNAYTVPSMPDHTVWKVVSKDVDGKEAFFLARIKDQEITPTVKAAMDATNPEGGSYSEVLVDRINYADGSIDVVPTNCPGKGKAQDMPIGDEGKPNCVHKSQQCPHLQNFTLAPLNGDKTIKCGIK